MALRQLASTAAINTGDGASAVDLHMLGHSLALLMVLILGVLSSAEGADDHVLGMWAVLRLVAEHPALVALGD